MSQIVIDHLGRGWSADEIARQYPHLSLAEIHSALAYYFDHEAEMNLSIRAELSEADGMASVHAHTPLALRLSALAHE